MKTYFRFDYLLLLFFSFNSCQTDQEKYDLKTGQTEVSSTDEIDSILNQFPSIKYSELPSSYHEYSDPYSNFKDQLWNSEYLIVKGEEVFQYVVGKSRIDDFLASDGYHKENLENIEANKLQFWLVDKKMLYMILEFINTLEEKGLNKYGFYVRESHRHPKLNKMRGGASKSQHLFGKAADLVIEDINNDGKKNAEDKAIALEILEAIVGNNGGMGLYPGTMTIHIDSRGYHARWDSY